MRAYRPEMSEEERADIDARALHQEGIDAKIRAEKDFQTLRKDVPLDCVVGCVYDIPIWHQDTTKGFWGRCPDDNPVTRRFRVYLHVWSEVLKEVVLVSMTEVNQKDFTRISR